MLKTNVGTILKKTSFWWVFTQALIGAFFIGTFYIKWTEAQQQIDRMERVQQQQSKEIDEIQRNIAPKVKSINQRLDRLAAGQDRIRKLLIESFRSQDSPGERGGFYLPEKGYRFVHERERVLREFR